ncbi:kinesin-related protein [Nymphaea thermarum]|nr:kinesin-related protein [Nymphaea thermarum]
MAGRHEKEKGVNVQVLLRCRPFNEDELRSNAPQVITCNEYQREVAVSQNIAGKQFDRVFTFDKVFGPGAQQKDLYDQAVVPIVNEVLEGFNCTIFAYGQTGTGKTYTMEGDSKKSKCGELPLDAGVIPRAVKQIFDTLESQRAEYSVKVTFLELYNEEITDLLAPEELSKVTLEEKQKKPLLLMEDGKGGVLVRGLEEEIVTSASEIFSLLERGSAKRRTAETLLNKQSSRSHSLFSITIHIKEATPEGEELIKCGKLNLVDLAGSENISRSGAREGRAREAGEINKSLLTLGRVITALVEHLGHVPYRDSKLTRLLRDSLGGRTKTCIIATVSPSVHCLEETLSTLDYAHRAKNIKNRPEVNQKMMKSTLIKDLYGEIDRLKAEVYAAREKNGVYIPKDRYHQEENERKAMSERIEQMESSLDSNQKQIEDLQGKYVAQAQHGQVLQAELDATQKALDETRKSLSVAKENLKRSHYTIREREYVISQQKKSENDLAHQAFSLRSDLEKSVRDVSALFAKIERKEKLNAGNRSLVDEFKTELFEKLNVLSNIVDTSMSQQIQYLEAVEKQCSSCLDFHDKSQLEFKKKMLAMKGLYSCHLETLQNVVRLHKANANANLEEAVSLCASDFSSLEEMVNAEAGEAEKMFKDIQTIFSYQQGEIANFARELKERSRIRIEFMKEVSLTTTGFFEKLGEESKKLQAHLYQTHEACVQSIADFQKAYEEQSKMDEERLLQDIGALVSTAMHRKKELVNMRLLSLRDAVSEEQLSSQQHVSVIEGVTHDAKRKWEEFSAKADNDAKDTADFSAAKHCRLEDYLQKCVKMTDAASAHCVRTYDAVKGMGKQHVVALESLVRDAICCNETHDAEVDSSRIAASEVIAQEAESLVQHVEGVSEHERAYRDDILSAVMAHSTALTNLRDAHFCQVQDIQQQSERCFDEKYVDYEPTTTTPGRKEICLPTKEMIEEMRMLPFEMLVKEFRQKSPYEDGEDIATDDVLKETKFVQSFTSILDSRSPLKELN